MRVIHAGVNERQIVPSNPGRPFTHIHNAGQNTAYLKFDGDDATLSTSIGFPLGAGRTLKVEDWNKNVLGHKVSAICASTESTELRIQGLYDGEDASGEMTAYRAAVAAAGGSLSAAQDAAVVALLKDILGSSVNGALQFIAPIVGNGIAAASVALRNFPNRSLQMTNVGFEDSDYAQATGITGDNASYIDCLFTQNDFNDLGLCHIGMHHVANDSTDGQVFFGSATTAGSSNGLRLQSGASGVQVQFINHENDTTTDNSTDEGHIVGVSNSGNAQNNQIFRDGVAGSDTAVTVSAGSTQSLHLFALNVTGSPIAVLNTGNIQFAHAGDVLTAAEVAALDTIIDTYGTALGW